MKRKGMRIACIAILLVVVAVVLIACGEAKEKEVYYVQGIDISQHQGNIDATQIDAKLVIVRLGYSGYESGKPNLDVCFTQNMSKLSEYEGEIALYWASHSITTQEVKEENTFIKNELSKLAPEMRDRIKYLFIDREMIHNPDDPKTDIGRADYISKELFNEVLSAQVNGLTKILDGVKVGVYTNVEYLKTMVDYKELGDVPYWMAWYTYEEPTSFEEVISRVADESIEAAKYLEKNIVMWQYSDKGEVPGITENVVDLNLVSSKMLK